MAPVRNGEKTMRKKATPAVATVADRRVGRNWRNPGARLDGSCQAERRGVVVTSSPPPKSTRWDGLMRASRSTSMPNIWCHTMSNIPPKAKRATPARPRP